MKYEKYFFLKKVNQEILNKKINHLFDIKTIFFKKLSRIQIINFAKQIKKNEKFLNYKKSHSVKRIVSSKKIKISKIKNYRVKKIVILAKKLNLNFYFKHLMFQGSVASSDFIKNWSDVDIFGVIKKEVIQDEILMLRLTKKLKIFYKEILNFSKFQHHGIMIYTEADMSNYLSGYLPPVALKINQNFFKDEKIIFYINKNKKNLSKKMLNNQRKFLKEAVKIGKYNHHVINNIPKLPFKSGDRSLYQLFYHMGTMINIPILFLDSKYRSSHKKGSFQKFYKFIKNKFVISFIKKHEKIRTNWHKYFINNNIISRELFNELGPNYLNNCIQVYNIILKKL